MVTRRTILATSTTATATLVGCLGDGGESTPPRTDTPRAVADGGTDLTITAPAFDDGESIPTEFTCDGADRSPALRIAGVPDAADSLALVVDDPDAPGGDPFTHWTLWNVPPTTTEIAAERPATETLQSPDGAVQGANDFDSVGYRGPCPPTGDGPHTYRFQLLALDTGLALDPGADRSAVVSALDGHRLATATLTGEYDR